MNFLLEIGTEEIPHWMIPGALKQLAAMNLFGATPSVDATPRRLVVRGSGLPERTPDEEQVIKGPPVSAGDKAAAGFAKKQGVELSAMTKVGDYYELRKQIPGRAVRDLLAETLSATILGIQWPKTMYWTGSKTGPRFIRPIRWIVALLDDQDIPFELAGVKSGNITRGHRILGSSSIPVTFDTYESELRKNFVILSADERRQKIVTEISQLGAKLDADLIETLTFITEYPSAVRGDFDPAFLELPAEVLTTVMRHHQKYFSVESAPGKLAPHFVAVMNTSGDPEGLVKRGNERVLKARFNDARFFWDVDQHKKLADRVGDLSHVTFQAKLGSYLEKTERVVKLVEELRGNAHAQRAAYLCKADLTTEMVKEFTDLQGQVGGLYARHQGEPESVAKAIYDHYKPLSMEGEIPSTDEGRLVALADKLDTLRACFEVELMPSGSKDPFGLRRAAQGVVRILAEGSLHFKLSDILDMTFKVPMDFVNQQEKFGGDRLEAHGNLSEPNGRRTILVALEQFLLDRIKYYFREVRGFKYDEVNAVLASGCGTLSDVEARLSALAAVRPTENFEPLAASFKRIQNILKQATFEPSSHVVTTLMEPGPEIDLFREVDHARRHAHQFAQGSDFVSALAAIASLRPAVDTFFDKVMVNAKDEKVRINRLTFLHNLLTEFSTIADFSEIVTSGDHK